MQLGPENHRRVQAMLGFENARGMVLRQLCRLWLEHSQYQAIPQNTSWHLPQGCYMRLVAAAQHRYKTVLTRQQVDAYSAYSRPASSRALNASFKQTEPTHAYRFDMPPYYKLCKSSAKTDDCNLL